MPVKLSVLTPAFNEASNLGPLYDRLMQTMAAVGAEWEWIVIDDHSRDGTFAVLEQLARRDPRVRGLRLARNSGSHVAITCALHHATGDAAVMLAADLQDPPETLGAMLAEWRKGAQVVWAVRRQRPGEKHHAGFAAIYYWIMRHVVGMKEMPSRGADFFLIDRAVIDAFARCEERNTSVLALITWLGFKQAFIEYDKQSRAGGRSGWTLAKKMKLVVDSITSFSSFPIRLCSYVGVAFVAVAVLMALFGGGLLPSLFIGLTGVQLIALGLVGEYVWRALDEARRRPIYLIEATTTRVGASSAESASPAETRTGAVR